MALIAKVTLRGVTQEQYDAVRAECGWLEESPAGGLTHLTWWEGPDCCNIDAWESEEAFTAFAERRLGPAMAAAGVTVEPEITFSPAHEVLAPRSAVIADTAKPSLTHDSNVAVIRSAYAAFAAGDIATVLGVLSDSVTWSAPDTLPWGARCTGPAEVGAFFAKLAPHFSELNVEPGVFLESGDTVTVLGMHHGVTSGGTAFDLPWVHVWSLARGKASSFNEYLDTTKLNAILTGQVEVEAMLRRIFDEVINEGRLDAVDELFTEDYLDHGPTGDIAGREGFKQMVAMWRSAVPDVHCEVSGVVVQGDRAGWLVRTTGTHTGDGLGFPATGRSFETVSANLGLLRDGKAAEHWAEQGMFPLLVQLGVIPAPETASA